MFGWNSLEQVFNSRHTNRRQHLLPFGVGMGYIAHSTSNLTLVTKLVVGSRIHKIINLSGVCQRNLDEPTGIIGVRI